MHDIQDISQDAQPQRPFLIEHARLDLTAGGSFRPAARLVLTPALRTSGLWNLLPGEEMKTLLVVLTFLNPAGRVQPALVELADAMQVSEGKARQRLERLAAIPWRGEPILRELQRESGLHAVAPADALFDVEDADTAPVDDRRAVADAPGRERVIAWSRARYARPRAEVEAEMAHRMGWDRMVLDASDRQRKQEEALPAEQKELLGELAVCGMDREQALAVVSAHPPDTIRRQIEWLPYRGAKSPARFLLAAIAGNYEPPLALRLRDARERLEEGEKAQEPPEPDEKAHDRPEPGEPDGQTGDEPGTEADAPSPGDENPPELRDAGDALEVAGQDLALPIPDASPEKADG